MTQKVYPLFASVNIRIQDNINQRYGGAYLDLENMNMQEMQNLTNYNSTPGTEMSYRLVTYVHMALIQWREEMEAYYADLEKQTR